MKIKKLFTTAAALFIAAACISPATAAVYADGEGTAYPEYPTDFNRELKLTAIADFAVCGDEYAFAQGTYLYILAKDGAGDVKLTAKDCGSGIKNLDYSEGTLYLGDSDGRTYAYPDLHTPVSYEFADINRIFVGEYIYYLTGDSLGVLDSGNTPSIIGNGYTLLKSYDNSAYAVQTVSSAEGDSCILYKLDGADAARVDLSYTAEVETIASGNFAQIIKDDYSVAKCTLNPTFYSGEELYFTYCTETDLNDMSGSDFKAVKTFKITGPRTVIKLATMGNTALIAMKDGNVTKTYLTHSAALTDEAYSAPAPDIDAAYVISDAKMYSVPYMSLPTQIAVLPRGATVQITEKCDIDAIEDTIYYKVTYEYDSPEDGQRMVLSGYVAANYLTPYSFAAEQNKPQSTGTEDFTYDTEIVSVILVIGIVGLVCIAIIYLTIVGTRGNTNSKQPKKKNVKSDSEYEDE